MSREGCAWAFVRVVLRAVLVSAQGKCVVSSGARGGQGWIVVQDAKPSGGAGKNGKSGAAAGAAADDADETDDQGCALPLCPPRRGALAPAAALTGLHGTEVLELLLRLTARATYQSWIL